MTENYVDGAWTPARAGGRREIRCPADGALVAEVAESTRVDTEAAIGAARRAYGEETYTRLVELKRRFDPQNLFRLNHNISP